jgi:hypothetical protein
MKNVTIPRPTITTYTDKYGNMMTQFRHDNWLTMFRSTTITRNASVAEDLRKGGVKMYERYAKRIEKTGNFHPILPDQVKLGKCTALPYASDEELDAAY